MAYVTQQDLIDRFGEEELIQLTDRTNLPATTIDGAVVSAAIADAENLADSYLAKRYRLPLDPVPAVLLPVVASLARHALFGDHADKDNAVTRNYRDAIAWLKDVAAGIVQLEAEGAAAAQPQGGQVQVAAPTKVFSRDTLRGY